MAVLFSNADLNKDYEIKAAADQKVVTPDGYSGMLSNISKASVLDGMIARKSNLVAKKVAAAPGATVVNKP